MEKALKDKIKAIKIVATDVDGVLTDGGAYYSSRGDTMKKFHIRDGMGANLLRRNNIPTVIITKEKNQIIKQWAKKMNIYKVYDGIIHKEAILEKLCLEFKTKSDNICYVGDDVNDLELMKKVGVSACPNDAVSLVKEYATIVMKQKSGEAAFRELVDLILSIKFPTRENFYE